MTTFAPPVVSALTDLTRIPLDDLSGIGAEAVEAALKRIFPAFPEASAGAAFQSAI